MKDRQYNDQKGKKTNDLQNTGQKTKDGTIKHRGEQMLHNGK